ncbi:MAG: hypothetical protein ABIT16_01695 [Croceibacterium sp.]
MTETTAAAPPRSARPFRPSFFFWMTLVMALFVFGGFGMTYLLPMSRGAFPPAPPIVHLHGLIFFSWMILLLVQAGLVGAGNIKLHRSLGTWGIAHATIVIYTGILVQLIASRRGMDLGRPQGSAGIYLGLAAFFGFSLMFTLAIRNTRRPEIHKRMILFAMLPLLPPGVNRFWAQALGLAEAVPVVPLYLTLWAMALAILVHEWRRTGRISGYSRFGAGWIVAEGVLHPFVVNSPGFDRFAAGLLGLVHYR